MALLTYLAHRRTYVRRDHLLALFWPESTPTHARGALRQALRFLRVTLGDRVLEDSGRDKVRVADGVLRFDVGEFEDCIDAGAWERAAALYSGEFLDGFFVGASHDFNDWVEDLRAGLRNKAARASWALAVEHERRGRVAEAAFWAKRSLGLSPHDEAGVRTVVGLLDRVGDRLGALRVLNGLRQRLARDFGVEPSPETRALLARVVSRTEEHPTPAPTVAHRSRRSPAPDRRRETTRRRSAGGGPRGRERRAVPDRRDGAGDRRQTPDRRASLG